MGRADRKRGAGPGAPAGTGRRGRPDDSGLSDLSDLKGALEALLFVAEDPLSAEQAAAALAGVAPRRIEAALAALGAECQRDGRGIQLQQVAGGWRFVTRPEHYDTVAEFLKRRRAERLSRAALETLAAIAYRQPITAPEVAALRGVDPTGSVKTLLDRGLVRILGRKKVVGKPFLYGTTPEFLVHFGLMSLDDLPSLEEFETVLAERARVAEGAEAEERSSAAAADTGEESAADGGVDLWESGPEGEAAGGEEE